MAALLGALRPARGLLWRLASPHPDPRRRLRLLADTREMFGFGFWDAAGAGAAASLTATTVGYLGLLAMILLGSSPFTIMLALWAPSLLCVPLSAGVAACAVFRSGFVHAMHRGRTVGLGRNALGLAFGLVIGGPLLAVIVAVAGLTGATGTELAPRSPVGPGMLALATIPVMALLIVVFAAAFRVYLAWVDAVAACWLPIIVGRPRPARLISVLLALCCLAALPWFSLLVPAAVGGAIDTARQTTGLAPLPLLWDVSLACEIPPLNLITWGSLVGLWAVPLSAAGWPGREVQTAAWAYLGPVESAPMPRPVLFVRRAAILGLLSGLAALGLFALGALPAPAALFWAAGFPVTPSGAVLLSLVLAGALAEPVAAGLIAVTVPRHRVLHGMFAAFLAGGTVLAGGLPLGLGVVQLAEYHLVVGGAVLALATAALAALSVALIGRIRGRAVGQLPGGCQAA